MIVECGEELHLTYRELIKQILSLLTFQVSGGIVIFLLGGVTVFGLIQGLVNIF